MVNRRFQMVGVTTIVFTLFLSRRDYGKTKDTLVIFSKLGTTFRSELSPEYEQIQKSVVGLYSFSLFFAGPYQTINNIIFDIHIRNPHSSQTQGALTEVMLC